MPPPSERALRRKYWGEECQGSILSPSLKNATRRDSAGGGPMAHHPPGRLLCRGYRGEDRSRRLPPRRRPGHEGQRGECRRLIPPAWMTVAPQIGRRFAGGASLTDGRHGTGVGGGRAGGAPSSGKTAAPRYCGEDRSRPLSSRRRPRDAGRRGECRRRTIPPADRRTANAGGGSIAASLSQTETMGRGSAGGGPEAHSPPGRPPRRKYWRGDRRRRHPP